MVVKTEEFLDDTVNAFTEAGIETVGLPLGTVAVESCFIPEEVQGIVITSSYALDALPRTDLPVYTVGTATAERAREKGFNVAFSGTGSSQQLAEKIAKQVKPCCLFHPHGDKVVNDWYDFLSARGFDIEHQEVYKVDYRTTLTDKEKDWFTSGRATRVAFFAATAVEEFLKAAQKHELDLKKIDAVFMSPRLALKISEKSPKKLFKSVIIAQQSITKGVVDAAQKQ